MTGGLRPRAQLDWGKLSTLRLRAEAIADGVFGGAHRSLRKGSGVEFGGHRSYVPGDDLRFLDRRAMMRHGRLLVREFETETDRGLRLLVDASASMAYRSEGAPVDKLAYAAVLAAALTRVAVAGSDTVSLDWLGGGELRPLPPGGGMHSFERMVESLEQAHPESAGVLGLDQVVHAARSLERRARRGTVVVVLSDFLDLPDGAVTPLAHLATRGRVLIAVRLLDPAELTFPFEGPVHFQAAEGSHRVETDGRTARAGFLSALRQQTAALRSEVVSRGGRLVEAATTDDPVVVLQRVLAAAARSRA